MSLSRITIYLTIWMFDVRTGLADALVLARKSRHREDLIEENNIMGVWFGLTVILYSAVAMVWLLGELFEAWLK